MLVLLQSQLLVTAGLKCIHGIKLWTETQMLQEAHKILLSGNFSTVFNMFSLIKFMKLNKATYNKCSRQLYSGRMKVHLLYFSRNLRCLYLIFVIVSD